MTGWVHYEIAAPIGAGGMGEVYRATDTSLGREVAIKVLPEDVAADEERGARFEREAKVLAGLNHPNVATLYGFETASLNDAAGDRSEAASPDEAAGLRAGRIRFLVMELTEANLTQSPTLTATPPAPACCWAQPAT